jgi:hypothetical protein
MQRLRGTEGQPVGHGRPRGSEETEAKSVNWSAMGDREDDISRRDWLSDNFNVVEANFREKFPRLCNGIEATTGDQPELAALWFE